MMYFVHLEKASSQNERLLMYHLKTFILNDIVASNISSSIAFCLSLYFAARSKVSANLITKLGIFSEIPLSFCWTMVGCRTMRAILLADHLNWSPFKLWRMAAIIYSYVFIGLLTCICAMCPLLWTPQLTSTKNKVRLWWEWTEGIHSTIRLTVALYSSVFQKLAG